MKRRVFLIGGFNKTRFLANSLIKRGFAVTAINSNEEKCRALSAIDKLSVFLGDGSKPFVLEDANAYNADLAIALSDRDADNLVICELCKKKFNVEKTVALVSDPRKTEFFRRMGVDSVVCAISTIASIIEQQALLDEIATIVPLGEGSIKITQVPIEPGMPAEGKKISEIILPRQVIIGCILHGERSTIPRGDTHIRDGDTLVLLSTGQHEAAALRELTGKV